MSETSEHNEFIQSELIKDIIENSMAHFEKASLAVRNNKVDDLEEIYQAALSSLSRISHIDWSKILQSHYNKICNTLDSWNSFSYRYNFDPPELAIPSFPIEKIRQPDRLSQIIRGKVLKKGSDKTITVAVEIRKTHPKYGKVTKRTKKYLVHDEFNQASEGDFVLFRGSRPHSARKRHEVLAIDRSLLTKPFECNFEQDTTLPAVETQVA